MSVVRMRKPIITIDGPAGAGKTTAARNLAESLSFIYLDTGATFRAFALKAIRQEIDVYDEIKVEELTKNTDIGFLGDRAERLIMDGEDVTSLIREQSVTKVSAVLASHRSLRRYLIRLWRQIGKDGGVVLEGRDIGTVVFPDAEVKFFLDARPEARAKRRYAEQRTKESTITIQRVSQDLTERDTADRNRRYSPLLCASDAIVVDTTDITPEQTLERLLTEVSKYLG